MKIYTSFFIIALLCGCTMTPSPVRQSSGGLPSGENVAVLNARANSSTNNQAERASAVFTLFAHHIRLGSSAADVHQALTDTAWLQESHLYGVRILGGWIPVEMTFEDTVFCIHLFPDDSAKEWSPWVIYFRLSGQLRDEDALAFLKGESVVGNPKLMELALCFPHSLKPRNLPGRIERYSTNGIHIYNEW